MGAWKIVDDSQTSTSVTAALGSPPKSISQFKVPPEEFVAASIEPPMTTMWANAPRKTAVQSINLWVSVVQSPFSTAGAEQPRRVILTGQARLTNCL